MSYSHTDVAAVVLAAGMGKRMNSDLAKVLHEMAGKPLLGHVLDTLDELGVARVVAVIGHQRERVEAAFAGRPRLEWAIQAEQRGTGHACMMAEPVLRGFPGTVLVVCGAGGGIPWQVPQAACVPLTVVQVGVLLVPPAPSVAPWQ